MAGAVAAHQASPVRRSGIMEIVQPTGVTSNGLTFAASVDEGILRAHDENHLATALVGGAAGGSEGFPAPQEENPVATSQVTGWRQNQIPAGCQCRRTAPLRDI